MRGADRLADQAQRGLDRGVDAGRLRDGQRQLVDELEVVLGAAARAELEAQLQLAHHQPRQGLQLLPVLVGKIRARLLVDDAEDAEAVTVARQQRRRGIEADMRRPHHIGVVLQARVPSRIRHHADRIAEQRLGGERRRPRGFADHDADARFEPLPLGVDQRDEGAGHGEKRGREVGDAVERLFRGGVEYLIAPQRLEALRLIR